MENEGEEERLGSSQTLTTSEWTEAQKTTEKEDLHCPNQVH